MVVRAHPSEQVAVMSRRRIPPGGDGEIILGYFGVMLGQTPMFCSLLCKAMSLGQGCLTSESHFGVRITLTAAEKLLPTSYLLPYLPKK